MNKLLTQQEVCELVRISYPTLYRWLKLETFPPPVNGRGRKLLWTQDAIEEWMSRSATPSDRNNADSPPDKSERQRAREFIERQERARRVLEQHGISRRGA